MVKRIRSSPAIMATVICMAWITVSPAAEKSEQWFNWTIAASAPHHTGVTDPFIGMVDGVLVFAGGRNCSNSEQNPNRGFRDEVYCLRSGADDKPRWTMCGRLIKPLAGGTTVSTPKGLICLGGSEENKLSDKVFLLCWDNEKQNIHATVLPCLPQPCKHPSATVLANHLYVVGIESNENAGEGQFWVLNLASAQKTQSRTAWQKLSALPGPSRSDTVLITQSDGQRDCLFLFGGRVGKKFFSDTYRFDRHADNGKGCWVQLAAMPHTAFVSAAAPWGESHVVVFSDSGEQGYGLKEAQDDISIFSSNILAYHTITDTWIIVGDLPQDFVATTARPWHEELLISGTRSAEGFTETELLQGKPRPFAVSFGPLDYAALGSYLSVLMLVGFYFTRREKTSNDFFLGGRRIPWWAAGLSLLATQASSIGFMAIPAKAYATNWVYFTGVGTWFLLVPLVNRAYIPFFRRLNVTSVYEYLELRFHLVVRLFGTLVYSLMQLGRMAVVLCLPALALSAVTGIDTTVCILLMGVICTAYTVAGGIEAVIWTDVVQAVLLLCGGLLCVMIVLLGIEGGPSHFVEIAMADHKFNLVELDWSYTTAGLWVILLGNFFTRLGGLTSDQAIVQRYLTTPDEAAAKRALWTDVAVSVPWAVIVFMLGTALYVFYKLHPDMLNATLHTDAVVPLFIAQKIPIGLSGLIIAAVFAAAMSSLDSSMHSVATIWVIDIFARFFPRSSDRARLNTARLTTLLLGIFGTATAVYMAASDIKSLWDQFMTIIGLFIGSITGVFTLGIFTRRSSAKGVMIGAIASAAVLFYVVYFTHVNFFLYSVIGCITCCVIGYVVSFVFPERKHIESLTIHNLKKSE